MKDDIHKVLQQRVDTMMQLTYQQATQLSDSAPEAIGDFALTTFRQTLGPGLLLFTVQAARRGMLGLASFHTERGVVFSTNVEPREATNVELQDSGG